MKKIVFPVKSQQGAVMVTLLILTTILSMLVVSQMNIVMLDEKVIANQKDRSLAFQAAESAVREAEEWVVTQVSEPEPTTDGGTNVWVTDAPGTDDQWWLSSDNDWWIGNGVQSMSDKNLPNISDANKPRYIIEHFAYVQDTLVVGQKRDELGRDFYRITARGFGGTDTARVTLQSTYTRRY